MEEISMRIGARGKFIDFWSRAVTGPICFESDFDKRVYWPKLKKITEKWGIKYDPDHMVPCDDEMLDRLWQAAIDLVAEVGVLCTDTRRIIEFSRKEILDAAANTADRYTVGVGKDSFTAVHRGFEDYDHVKNPVSVLGRILGPVSQDIYHQIAMSYAQVPQIDMCHFQGNLTEIYGMPITPDSPWEMFSELWSVAQVKDVCRQVCRPGLADGGIRAIAMSAMQAAFDPGWGANKGDFRCCLTLPHQKVEYKHLSRALQWHTYGINFYSVMTSYPGGLSGGPATSAVTGTAEWIIQKLLFDVPLNGSWSVDAMYFSNTSKYSLWCSNHQNAAVTKNTVCEPLTGGGWQMTHGIAHENFFWESAASAISAVVLGNGVSGGTGAQSGLKDHQSGLGLQFSAEVGEAVAKARLTRAHANDLVKRIMAKYQPTIDSHTAHKMGGDFRECYNLVTVQPQKWYMDMYDKVKKELTQMGLPMEY